MDDLRLLQKRAKELVEFFRFIEPELTKEVFSFERCKKREDFVTTEEAFKHALLSGFNPAYNSRYDKLTFMINRVPSFAQSSDKDVTKIRLLAVDMDHAEGDPLYIHYDKLIKSAIPPHIVLKTRANGRYQAFWKVDGLPVWAFKPTVLKLQRHLTEIFLPETAHVFDRQVSNPSRLMRVPFFKAQDKDDGSQHLAELIRLDTALPTYSVTDSTGGLIEALYGGYDSFVYALARVAGIEEQMLLEFNLGLLKPLPEDSVKSKFDRQGPGRPKLAQTDGTRNNVDPDYIDSLTKRFIYLRKQEKYLDTETMDILSLNNLITYMGTRPYGRFRQTLFEIIEDITFRPVPEDFIKEVGKKYFNIFRDRRIKPNYDKLVNIGGVMRCEWFDQYLNNAFPPQHHRLIREWLATTVVHPEIKLQWALVLSGKQEAGKSSLFDIASALFGDSTELGRVCKKVSAPAIESPFNGYLEGTLLLGVEEMEFGNKTGAYNKSKSLISDDSIHINQKNEKTRTDRAYHNVFITTNSSLPVRVIDKGDRKICFVKLKDDFKRIPKDAWDNYLTNDIDALMAELLETSRSFEITRAPHTPEKNVLLEDSKTHEQYLLDEYVKFLIDHDQLLLIPASAVGRERLFGMHKAAMREYLDREHGISRTINIVTGANCMAYVINKSASVNSSQGQLEYNRQKQLYLQFNNMTHTNKIGTRIDFTEE